MWSDETNHFYRRSQVINDFVKRFGNGDSVGWQIFGFRRKRKYRSGMAGEDKKSQKGVAFFMRYLYQHNSGKNNPAADQIHQGIVFILQ